MKTKFLLFCFVFALCANTNTAKAQVNKQDSLALVDLYNSTDGANWKRNDNWLTSNVVSTWRGITVTGTRVTKIRLVNNNLVGNIPSSIGNLSGLEILELYVNHLNGSIPSSIGNCAKLQNLNLAGYESEYNQLSGSIPTSIGNLVNLQTLVLTYNQLSGGIPSSIGNLVNLQTLALAYNQLSGSIPSSIGNLVNLKGLDIHNNQLSGSIPSSIGNLINLTGLGLWNNQLSGSIPSSIGNLVNLQGLTLSGNQLSGSIPSSIGNLVNLLELELDHNQLSGSIPSSLGNLVNMFGVFTLNNNRLSGSIPSSLGNLVYLEYDLDLSNNHLSGNIPSSLGNLVNLYNLQLNNNQLSGNVPLIGGEYYTNLSRNHFTFDGLEKFGSGDEDFLYSPQANIPIHQKGNTLSVYAGGTLSNNTYRWFKCDGTTSKYVATINGDSTFHPLESGRYRVMVSNSVATQLKLFTKLDYTAPTNAAIASAQNELQQYEKTNLFRVYPNPAKDILYVETNCNATFSLINQSGKILLTVNINGKGSINISGITPGLYYLKNNTTGAVQKVVIGR